MISEYFFVLVTAAYFLIHLLLLKGLVNSFRLKKVRYTSLPTVSVIVAARNESENIKSCIQSLKHLEYPCELLEIILVNDNSTDDTFEIMKNETKDNTTFKVINSRESGSENLKGKANALDTAIEQCTGEIIVSTDADCVVQPEWVSATVGYYRPDTGMVCGFTMIESEKSIFAKMQAVDWMYLLTLASSSAGLNMILSCLGNNLSFFKKAYYKVGGYSAMKFSVTEDLALMRMINSHPDYKVIYPVDKDCLVKTLPCRNLKELFSQKRRWFKGGIGINSFGYILGFELYAMNILLAFGWIFLDRGLWLILILVKMISEFFLLSGTLGKLQLRSLYKYYPLFVIYFVFYGLILPVSFLFKTKIKWKDRKL